MGGLTQGVMLFGVVEEREGPDVMNRMFPAVVVWGMHFLFLGLGACRVGSATLEIRPGPDRGFIQLDSWTDPGRLYLLQSRSDLRSPLWIDLESIVGTGGAERRFRAVEGSEAGFYRLRELVPWGGGDRVDDVGWGAAVDAAGQLADQFAGGV